MKVAIVLLALAVPVAATNYLFAGCTEQSSRTIDCESQSLAEVPEGIPDGFEKIRLAGNVIHDASSDDGTEGELSAAQLTHIEMHPSITEIQLQQNGIDAIADNTFVGFPNLLVLRLFGNQLRTITANALNGLSSLTTLYINNNANLASLQSGAFSAFAATLAELFAKECGALALVEDNSVNALTHRPLFVDMIDDASICMVSPSGALECVCAAGHVGNANGYCEVSDAPSPSPTTAAPVTAAPVTAAPVTAAPVTAAPVTAAPVTAAPVTAAPVTAAPVTAAPTPATVDATTAAAATTRTGIFDGIIATTVADDDQNRGTAAPDDTTAEEENRGAGEFGGSKGMGSKSGGAWSEGGGKGGGKGGSVVWSEGGSKGGGKGGGKGGSGGWSEGGGSKAHSIGKMELDVSYQPWGNMKSRVQLDGNVKSSATAVLLSSMFVVAAAIATVKYRRATAKNTQLSVHPDGLEAASPGMAERMPMMGNPPAPKQPYGTGELTPVLL